MAEKKSVLVTGATGFIGSRLVSTLMKRIFCIFPSEKWQTHKRSHK